jgi:hypothetical protein
MIRQNGVDGAWCLARRPQRRHGVPHAAVHLLGIRGRHDASLRFQRLATLQILAQLQHAQDGFSNPAVEPFDSNKFAASASLRKANLEASFVHVHVGPIASIDFVGAEAQQG